VADVIECQQNIIKLCAIIKTDLYITQKDYYYIRLFHIYRLSCQRQLTTKWKLGLRDDSQWTCGENSLKVIEAIILNDL
jgi:hypothetical protein